MRPRRTSETENLLDLETWCIQMLDEIRGRRESLNVSVEELTHCLNGAGLDDSTRSEKICQLTRLLIDDGETLHCLTQLYTILSHRPVPPEAWNPQLVENVKGLLAKAPEAVSVAEYRRNCQERVRYAQTRWDVWSHPEKRPDRTRIADSLGNTSS